MILQVGPLDSHEHTLLPLIFVKKRCAAHALANWVISARVTPAGESSKRPFCVMVSLGDLIKLLLVGSITIGTLHSTT